MSETPVTDGPATGGPSATVPPSPPAPPPPPPTPPPTFAPPPPSGPSPAAPRRRLTRSLGDRKVAGVCGGLGAYFGIDPVIIRILIVVLTIFGGSGLLL